MMVSRSLKTLLVTAGLCASSAAFGQSANKASHVDFDDQLIQGQVNKGAVHLIERKDSDLGSLVKVRKSYRKEILAGTEQDAATPAVMVAAMAPVPVARVEAAPAAVAPVAPVARPAAPAIPAPVKKVDSRSKPSSSAKTNGGSRAISRR